jgi:hypothetical protein
MDNTSTANTNKAFAASSWSPSKWVAGLMGREAPIAATTAPTADATADDAVNPKDDYVPITAAAASITFAAAAARTTAATANSITAAAAATTATAATATIKTKKTIATKRKMNTAAATASISATTTRTTTAAASSFDGTLLYSPTCNWAVEECLMVGLPLKNCQRFGCNKHLHHLCSIQWEMKNNLPEDNITMLCRAHHLHYKKYVAAMTAASPSTTPAAVNNITGGVNLTPPVAAAGTIATANATIAISSVSKDTQGKSPIYSTAHKMNPKTATMKKMNKKGDMVEVVLKEAQITKGIRVFSERSKLIPMVKQEEGILAREV